jgi:hypothetical protein
MATSQAEGSQTATIDTEHTLATVTTAGTYALSVDLSNLALGDKVTLRAKVKVRSTGTTRTAFTGTYAHTQENPVAISIPIPTVSECVFSLEQTDGIGRAFDWEVISL